MTKNGKNFVQPADNFSSLMSYNTDRVMVGLRNENLETFEFRMFQKHGSKHRQEPSLCVAVPAENHGATPGVGIQNFVM